MEKHDPKLYCIYTKYAWVVPLKDKRGIRIAKITKKIFFKSSL